MKIEKRLLEGREHYVCPVVLIVEGILNGSQGPVHYPRETFRPHAWNGRPIVVYHPNQYGKSFAGDPDVFSKSRIGTLFNAKTDGSRLKAEAWIDCARADALDTRVSAAIRAGRPMEVSTGLVVHHGDERTADGALLATFCEPDHLAVLPTGRGACSLADGAGLLVNCGGVLEPLLLPEWSFA